MSSIVILFIVRCMVSSFRLSFENCSKFSPWLHLHQISDCRLHKTQKSEQRSRTKAKKNTNHNLHLNKVMQSHCSANEQRRSNVCESKQFAYVWLNVKCKHGANVHSRGAHSWERLPSEWHIISIYNFLLLLWFLLFRVKISPNKRKNFCSGFFLCD